MKSTSQAQDAQEGTTGARVGGIPAVSLLADGVTSLGLLAGCFALVAAINDQFEFAGLMIWVSIACDISDGLVARAAHTSNRFGLELDSLSDVVTFGVAPAILADSLALKSLGAWAVLLVGAYIVCAALRLARFNVQADLHGGKRRFVGLPVPGAAAAIVGIMFGYQCLGLDAPRALRATMVVIMPTLAALMVSRVPYMTIKVSDPRSLISSKALCAAIGAVAVVIVAPRLTAFVVGVGYLLSGPIMKAIGGSAGGDSFSRASEEVSQETR
jgi:CDP-diacylglycerol--serine O-phosphatidyltransferase